MAQRLFGLATGMEQRSDRRLHVGAPHRLERGVEIGREAHGHLRIPHRLGVARQNQMLAHLDEIVVDLEQSHHRGPEASTHFDVLARPGLFQALEQLRVLAAPRRGTRLVELAEGFQAFNGVLEEVVADNLDPVPGLMAELAFGRDGVVGLAQATVYVT